MLAACGNGSAALPDFGPPPAMDLMPGPLGCNGLMACFATCTDPTTAMTCIQSCLDKSSDNAAMLAVDIIKCKFNLCAAPGTSDGGAMACDPSTVNDQASWSTQCLQCIGRKRDSACPMELSACTADKP
jgi:hypothetical protein